MAFQAQQAPNYQGAASDMGKHLASMGQPNMTYALAKRARDEKRADIKLQKDKDDRAFILGNIKEGLGIMRQNTLLDRSEKREDKQSAQIQENWKSLEPERISKLQNSLNKEWSIEYGQKQRELNRINQGGVKDHAARVELMGADEAGEFRPVSMADYLAESPMIAKRHTLAETTKRYHGGIGDEDENILKGASTEDDAVTELSAEESEQKRQDDIKKFNVESQARANAANKARIAQRDHEKAMAESQEERKAAWLKSTEKRDSSGRVTNIEGRAKQKRREAIRKHEQKQEEEATAKKEESKRKVDETLDATKRKSAYETAKRTGREKVEAQQERKAAYGRAETTAKHLRQDREGKEAIVRMDQMAKENEERIRKREAAKRESEERPGRTVAASKALRKAEKSKEQRLKKERKAKAQEVVAKGKDKRERQEAYKKAEDAAQKKREERKAKKEAERKRVVTSSKVQRKIKQGRKDEMDKWSEEFGKEADKHVAEQKAAERKAVAQETVETSKRKSKGESIMEKIQHEKEKADSRGSSESRSRRQQSQLGEKQAAWGHATKRQPELEAAGTSIREEAEAADDKLVQQFKDNAAKYSGTRKMAGKLKEANNYIATLNRKTWNDETKAKFFTKGSDGAFKPKDVKDDPNAEKKSLSHWIEKEDADDGGEWKGVTKNPVEFFLKNPDKLKNLSTNNRKTMLKKMSKSFNKIRTLRKS